MCIIKVKATASLLQNGNCWNHFSNFKGILCDHKSVCELAERLDISAQIDRNTHKKLCFYLMTINSTNNYSWLLDLFHLIQTEHEMEHSLRQRILMQHCLQKAVQSLIWCKKKWRNKHTISLEIKIKTRTSRTVQRHHQNFSFQFFNLDLESCGIPCKHGSGTGIVPAQTCPLTLSNSIANKAGWTRWFYLKILQGYNTHWVIQ